MTEPREIGTERLVLRQWQPADFAPFAQLNADPQVMEFLPALLSPEESGVLAQRLQTQIATRGWGLWATQIRTSGKFTGGKFIGGEFIGFVGLQIPAVTLPFSPCVEIGWRLAVSAWGQGYATEAARAALQFGFQELGLSEIVSLTAVLNRRSEAVMQRLGMVRQPEEFEHPAVPIGHRLRRHCWYKISRPQ